MGLIWDDIPLPGIKPTPQQQPLIPEPVIDQSEKLSKQFDEHEAAPDTAYYGELPESAEPGLEGQFYLSQSLIKKLVDQHMIEVPHCPRNIYHLFVKKDFKSIKSEPMIDGLYGESLILGHNAKNEGKIKMAKNIRTGAKRISQERIEIQAERFNHIALINQFNIIPEYNTQVPIFKRFNNSNVIIRGELDVFPTTVFWEDKLRLAIVDIKFTGDVNNTFGNFGWGNNNLDYIQGDLYNWLVRDFDRDLNLMHGSQFNRRVGYGNIFTPSVLNMIANDQILFLYVILGYKKADLNDQVKIIERMYKDPTGGDLRQRELKERIRMSLAILTQHHHSGWQPNHLPDVCKECPVSCNRREGYCDEPNKPIKV